jgi:hypothetical protein
MAETSTVLLYELFDPVTVLYEMAASSNPLVAVPADVIERVTEGDSDPKFATFVIESGWSKSNRLWDTPIFDSVHEQISEAAKNDDPIVGYLGHIKPDDDAFAFPEIQFQWLRSALKKVGNKAHIFTKAYVLPDTKARYYLKKGLAKTVSWYGPAEQIPFQKGVRVSDFRLESIDLARPRKAGMSARLVGALTSEMEMEGAEVKPEEIASLQENELRAHNPNLVQKIEQEATKPLSEKVSEMESNTATLKTQADLIPELRKLLGISEDADPLEIVRRLVEEAKKAGRGAKERLLDQLLAKKFKDVEDKHTLSLIRRTLVGEMEDGSIEITGDDEKDEKAISEMVNSVIDGDNDLKALVSEMEQTPVAVPGTSDRDNDGGKEKIKAGYEDSNMTVRSRR